MLEERCIDCDGKPLYSDAKTHIINVKNMEISNFTNLQFLYYDAIRAMYRAFRAVIELHSLLHTKQSYLYSPRHAH
jgi:hypothetical protein